IAVKPSGGGYPAGRVQFTSPVDFSKHDVLAVWFKTKLPITYFDISFNGANGVVADHNLFLAAAMPASRLQTDFWYNAYIEYQIDPGWLRGGTNMNLSQISGLTFYAWGDDLALSQPTYDFSFGGMTLFSL